MVPSRFHFVPEMAKRFMTLTDDYGKPTPMDVILQLKAVGGSWHDRERTSACRQRGCDSGEHNLLPSSR